MGREAKKEGEELAAISEEAELKQAVASRQVQATVQLEQTAVQMVGG